MIVTFFYVVAVAFPVAAMIAALVSLQLQAFGAARSALEGMRAQKRALNAVLDLHRKD